MSNTPHRATPSPGKSRKKNVTLDLPTARRMLPLVRGITAEIVAAQAAIDRLVPEQEALDRTRRSLDWAGRQRRYAVQDEIAQSEKSLNTAVLELDALGLSLADAHTGTVDFPTRINGRPAAFTWQHGEDAVGHWRYAGEGPRRPIPADWQSGTPTRARGEA